MYGGNVTRLSLHLQNRAEEDCNHYQSQEIGLSVSESARRCNWLQVRVRDIASDLSTPPLHLFHIPATFTLTDFSPFQHFPPQAPTLQPEQEVTKHAVTRWYTSNTTYTHSTAWAQRKSFSDCPHHTGILQAKGMVGNVPVFAAAPEPHRFQ